MNEKKNSMLATVPAARELRKVPGFDPLKYLRTVTRDGEKVLKLDLCYKKLWFRLACPNGRMYLNPLRITDQMAIFEARLYANKEDNASFLASFTSTQMARNVPGGLYIRAAQDEALNEALDNAGFGIQLCDVAQVSDGNGFGSEVPLSQVETHPTATASAGTPILEAEPVNASEPAAVPAEKAVEEPKPTETSEANVADEPPPRCRPHWRRLWFRPQIRNLPTNCWPWKLRRLPPLRKRQLPRKRLPGSVCPPLRRMRPCCL